MCLVAPVGDLNMGWTPILCTPVAETFQALLGKILALLPV